MQWSQWANPRALILNIQGAIDRSSLKHRSGAKYKLFTLTFLILNRIIFPLDGFQPHHPPFIPNIRLLILIHCSLFICHVKFDHCRRHLFFPLNVFYLVQTWFQSCTPECTNSLAFSPVLCTQDVIGINNNSIHVVKMTARIYGWKTSNCNIISYIIKVLE